MSDYWSTVVMISAYLTFLVAFPAAALLGVRGILDGDWRMWVGANMCVVIGILNMAYVLVHG